MKNDVYKEVVIKSQDYAKVLEAEFERAFDIIARNGRTLEMLQALVNGMVSDAEAADKNIVWMSRVSRPQLACSAGCSACCFLPVSALTVEVLMLADYLRATLSVEELGALRKRVADAADQGNDPAVSLKARIPCPLLDNHRCSAYERRPITCRAHTSTSRRLCEEMKDHPERTVQTGFDALRLRTHLGARTGVYFALMASGFDGSVIRFVAGLRIALETEGCTEQWLAGEPLFGKIMITTPAECKQHHEFAAMLKRRLASRKVRAAIGSPSGRHR